MDSNWFVGDIVPDRSGVVRKPDGKRSLGFANVDASASQTDDGVYEVFAGTCESR